MQGLLVPTLRQLFELECGNHDSQDLSGSGSIIAHARLSRTLAEPEYTYTLRREFSDNEWQAIRSSCMTQWLLS